MMISMTGFGKSVGTLADKTVTIEIKSLNSKQLDIYTRLPNVYKDKDLEIRNLISQRLKRGKIECSISFENNELGNIAKINTPAVLDYYKQLSEIASNLNLKSDEGLLHTIMRFPEVLRTNKEELPENEWKELEKTLLGAILAAEEYRKQEGDALEKDILFRVSNILGLLEAIIPYEADRMEKMREKLNTSLTELVESEKIDPNRFEQELIYYLEKLDITEERVRLKNHCDFFGEVLEEKDPVGKKLGFIAQEMGREINTIGSKANHSEIQRLVVQMKDELEKIKEQLMNIL